MQTDSHFHGKQIDKIHIFIEYFVCPTRKVCSSITKQDKYKSRANMVDMCPKEQKNTHVHIKDNFK